ncbi:MAG: acyl carrier protein [Steroidobacteraceae bacterium]
MNASSTRTMDAADVHSRIRRVLKDYGRLRRDAEQLSEHDDLYEAGMSPHASADVMLALESEFELEFPDQMLNRSVFDSIGTIACAIECIDAS